MPVQGKHVDASRLLRSNAPCQSEEKHDAQHDQSSGNVKAVQANQRVVRCSKKVRGDGQPAFVDQAVPFLAGAKQKERTQDNGEKPQSQECSSPAALERPCCEVNRETAREQANRVEDGCLKHFAGRWSCEALPRVKQIGHYE